MMRERIQGQVALRDLIESCLSEGKEADWLEFVSRTRSIIGKAILRTLGRCDSTINPLVDDLIQETYVKLCHENFKVFRSLNASEEVVILSYLRVIAANVTLDYLRAQGAKKRGSSQIQVSEEDAAISVASNSYGSVDAIERNLLLTQISGALDDCLSGKTKDRDKAIFYLYFLTGATAASIANNPTIGISIKGVESVIQRVTQSLRHYFQRDTKQQQKAEGKQETSASIRKEGR